MTNPRRSAAIVGLLVAGIAAPVATVGALGGSGGATAVAIPAGMALLGYWYRAPQIWPEVDRRRARAAVVIGELLALFALVLAFFANWAISTDEQLCANGAASTVALGIAAAVYAAAGVLLLRRATRLVWLWPLLVLGLWATSIVVRIALPGGHGFCES